MKLKSMLKNTIRDLHMHLFVKDLWEKRIQYVETEYDEHLDKLPVKATYKDSYNERPNLMINYLAP